MDFLFSAKKSQLFIKIAKHMLLNKYWDYLHNLDKNIVP